MMIFTAKLLSTNEIGVSQHQPLRALPLEIDLNPGMRAIALEIEHDAAAELGVPDPAAHAHRRGWGFVQAAAALHENRARYLQPRPYLLDEFRRQFADEAGGLAVSVHAVQPALLGIGDVQMPHGASRADVAQAALLLQPRQVRDGALMR